MIITDVTWLTKIVNIACFQIYGIIRDLCVVDQLSMVNFSRIMWALTYIVFERWKHSKQSIYPTE